MLFGNLTDRRACVTCARKIRDSVEQFAQEARMVLGHAGPESAEWGRLTARVQSQDIPLRYVLHKIESDSVAHLERFVATCSAAGEITADEIQEFRRRAAALEVEQQFRAPVEAKLERAYAISEIRAGNLPTVEVKDDIFLDSDEQCHLYRPAHYDRQLQTRVASVSGTMVLTNKKFMFIGHGDGWELAWTKIVDANSPADRRLDLYASQKRGSGRYHVKDADFVAAIIATLVRMAKRQTLGRAADPLDTSIVPQHIKSAVFRRDNGRCRECGSDRYLEFDHVIPRSKGGATSENNLQLLCRACNQRKGNRI